MQWRVSLLRPRTIGKDGPVGHTWMSLGIVEADSEEDVRPFAEREWGLVGADNYNVTAIIEEGHAQYLYKAVCEFLEEIEGAEPNSEHYYPESTAVEWMNHAISLVEDHDNMEESKPPRRV